MQRLSAQGAAQLAALPDELSKQISGQGHAVRTAARALQRARVGLKDAQRPIASLLFAGPTGVGKTSLTNALAEHMFGSVVCPPSSLRNRRVAVVLLSCALVHSHN